MPLYEYRCAECGTKFELRRSMSASDEPATCPQCASDRSQRELSLFVAMTRGETGTSSAASGGCGCGGACSCGGHGLN